MQRLQEETAMKSECEALQEKFTIPYNCLQEIVKKKVQLENHKRDASTNNK